MRRARGRGGAQRRGYALALVVALSAVFVIMVALMLDRDSVSVRAARRQAQTYADHHLSKGMQEGLAAWMRSNAGEPIGAALDDDGLAFTIEADSGQSVEVYLEQAQGTLLADLSGLTGPALEVGLRALKGVVEQTGGDRALIGRMTRTHGPLQVSVREAPVEVLRAIAGAVLDSTKAEDLVSQIEQARAEGESWERVNLGPIFTQVNVSEEERALLQMMLAGETALWRVVLQAVPRTPRPGVEPVRYGGLLHATSGPMRNSAGESATQRNTGFLTWDRIETWEGAGRGRGSGRESR